MEKYANCLWRTLFHIEVIDTCNIVMINRHDQSGVKYRHDQSGVNTVYMYCVCVCVCVFVCVCVCVCMCVSKLIFSTVNASKYGNASVGQSRVDGAHRRKMYMKMYMKHGMHNTVTKHAYPSRHQRKFAYTNIFWLGSIVMLFFIILRVF